MKKFSSFLLLLTLLTSVCHASSESNYDTWHISSPHMKEFNLSQLHAKIPQIINSKQRSSFLNTVNFEKNTSVSSERLKELFSDKIGTKLSSEDISKMREKLINFYKANGYKSAVVDISNEKNEKGSITFIIYEGPKSEFK